MKILLCITKMDMGGAETHLLELARELTRLGHKVDIAAGPGRLSAEAEATGLRVFSLPPWRRSPGGLWRLGRRLSKIVKRGGYHVIHAHSRPVARAARSIARRRGLSFVVTAHAYFNMKGFGRLSEWGNRTIAVSRDIKELLARCGVRERHIYLIPNGIDTARFCPAGEACPAGSPQGRRVVFVSRLDNDCSAVAMLLCRLAGRLNAAFPDISMQIVGGGDAYGQVEGLAELMNTACGRVVVSMMGARRDVETVLQGAALFVGVSRAAMEAAACGLPVIIAGNEGYGGIFRPTGQRDDTNLCARGQDLPQAEGLFEDICRVLNMTAAERRELGRRGRQYVLTHHSLTAMARQTLTVYERAY